MTFALPTGKLRNFNDFARLFGCLPKTLAGHSGKTTFQVGANGDPIPGVAKTADNLVPDLRTTNAVVTVNDNVSVANLQVGTLGVVSLAGTLTSSGTVSILGGTLNGIFTTVNTKLTPAG